MTPMTVDASLYLKGTSSRETVLYITAVTSNTLLDYVPKATLSLTGKLKLFFQTLAVNLLK